MTIAEFLEISDPEKPMIVQAYNGDTGEITVVCDTTECGDYPFDILYKTITFMSVENGTFILEYMI